MRMILYQNLPLYSSLTNYTKISKSMRTFRETPCSLGYVKLKRRGNFILRMRTIWLAQRALAVELKIGVTSINMK